MAKITFISHNGQAHIAEVAPGWSLMEGAVKNGVPGIDAECGGATACGTCHVYIDPAWLSALPPKDEDEEEMLDLAAASAPNSRLSCQIQVTPDLDGLVVRIPISQH